MTKTGRIIALTSIIILYAVSLTDKALKYSDIPQFVFEYKKNDNGGITITDYIGKKTDLIIPDKIKKLPVTEIRYMGNNHKLKSVIISENVKKISDWAFFNCSELEYIDIPESIEYIGEGAFIRTPFEKNLGSDDFIIINDKILYRYDGNSENITIPDGIQSICSNVFTSKNIRSVKIPESVEYIGKGAFSECKNLESINIPENVKSIEPYVFAECDSLSDISLSDETEKIGYSSFYGSGIENIKIPDKITEIPESAFENCSSLENIILSDNIKTINKKAFQNCTSLENINFPENLENIEDNAFSETALKEIILPESISVLGNHAFRECTYAEKIKLSSNLKTIPIECFDGCKSLTEIEIPEGIETIEMNAFQNNSSLKHVRLPDSLKSIDLNAFAKSNIESVFIPDNVEYFNRQAFLNDIEKSPVTLMCTENCLAIKDLEDAEHWRIWNDYELKIVNSRNEAEKFISNSIERR